MEKSAEPLPLPLPLPSGFDQAGSDLRCAIGVAWAYPVAVSNACRGIASSDNHGHLVERAEIMAVEAALQVM
jgi:hypothetical protein